MISPSTSRGVGTTKGLVLAEKDLVDAEPDQNIHVTLDSTETDLFPTLREYDGDSVIPYSWAIVVDDHVEYEFLPLGREGDPPLTMKFEGLPPGMTFEQVTITDTSGYRGPTLIISGTPTREGTFGGSYKVTDSDGDTFSFPFSFEVVPQQPQEPTLPLPVVSFATSEERDTWDTVGTVNALLLLSDPAPQPLTIKLGGGLEGVYSHPSSISVAKGATSATVQITIHNARGNSIGLVFLRSGGSGYTIWRAE